MARKFGSVNVDIWGDPDFRELPPAAQHLYLLLWTSPDLSFCGVHDWRPGRLTHLSRGFTETHTRTVAASLAARHFLVIDEATEEVLIRSWARFDETVKQPRLAVSYVKAYASVYSAPLRSVLVHETKKMRDLWPDLACWSDDRVLDILTHPASSAKDLPTPEDPFAPSVGHGFGDGFALGLPQTLTNVWGSVCPPPTPAPTPTPKPLVVKGGVGGNDSDPQGAGRKRPAKPLPEDWKPTDSHLEYARGRGLDVEHEAGQFRAHAEANDRRQVNWNAAFRQWLGIAKPGRAATPQPVRHLPDARDLEPAPSGMTDEESAAWMAEQIAKRRRA